MRKLIYSILFIISIFGMVLQAQTTCDNFTVNTVVTPSTCQSNGTVTVTLTGADAAGLFNVQYSLEPTVSGGFFLLPTANNVLSGIPAGTYTVTVSAFCDALGEYSVVKTKTNIVVGGTYQVPELSFVATGVTSTTTVPTSVSRSSYAGCVTGRIVMTMKDGNQTTTPVFTITSAPTGISTPQTVSVTRNSGGSLSAGYTYTLDGLYPGGNYTIEINDGCYTASRSFTLGELTDVPNPNGTSTTMSYSDIYPYIGDNQDCALIRLSLDGVTSATSNADLYQYYREGLYEIGAAPLGGEPEQWTAWTSTNPILDLGSHQISEFYSSPNKMSVYFRVKNCPTVRERYDVYIYKPSGSSIGHREYCDYVRYRRRPTTTYSSVYCYPITYKVVNNSTGDVLIEQSGITNPTQIVDSVSLEYNTTYAVSFTDKAGTIYSSNVSYSFPNITSYPTSDNKYCDTWVNYYYRPYLYCYPVYVDIKDSGGTTVALDTIYSSATASNYSPPLEYDKAYTFNFTYPGRIVNGNVHTSSYPKTVANTLPTLNLSIYQYDYYEGCEINEGSLYVSTGSSSRQWPAGTVITVTGPPPFTTQTYTQSSTASGYNFYRYGIIIPPGNYTVTADYGCDTPYSMTTYLPGTYDVKDFTYKTEKTCDGMSIIPSGTLTYMENEVTAKFRLSAGPAGYDKNVVTSGGKITLSAAGTYTLSVVVIDDDGECDLTSQTIVYTAPPMELDNTRTSAYACVGSNVGIIMLQAVNGVAPYTYELWDENDTTQLQGPQKSSGQVVYNYGTPGSTYSVHVTDDCGNSFAQTVVVANLETAKLIIADSNPVCYGNDINLRCLTLGITDYHWTYPDGTTIDGQAQVISGANSSKAGWYKVSVEAEHCGSPVTDSIYISVYNPISITDPVLANQTFEICPKASLTLGEAVTGGSGNYTYKWEYSSNGTTWYTYTTTSTLTVTGPTDTAGSYSFKYLRRTVTDAACGGFVENYLVNAIPCYIPVNPDLMNLGTGNPMKK
ncbi:hypothetical protein [Dysgonomonas gadei]|uniref:Ig-like domain-containing protein n=1 Tax=Dysgonomonas gadei ATCC BAA-286 TaxID=742766 RepID=F5ITN8_9BACT|nr:hypothetical protein [Dysgonomonas gadei]EGJ99422.1 hypothetical protein HMPREF9455_00455 [Dysgonomonas gadei ATCC BAA-286]